MKQRFYIIPKKTLLLSLLACAGVCLTMLSSSHFRGFLRTYRTLEPALAEQPAQKDVTPQHTDGENFDTLFGDMLNMRKEMNRLFHESFERFPMARGSDSFTGETGGADISDEGNKYVVSIDLPGVEKSKIDLRVNDDRLQVSAERSESLDQRDEHFIRKERRLGRISRVIHLPGPVKSGETKAKYENGVLKVTAAKDTTHVTLGDKIEVQ